MTKEQELLKKELKKEILQKLEAIQNSIISEKGIDSPEYFQMLIMVADDLGDVLLNWED
jgi:hypothetical protein